MDRALQGGQSLRRTSLSAAICTFILSGLMTGCATPPPPERPALDMPAAWALEAPWRTATPADAADKGPWWQRFNDRS